MICAEVLRDVFDLEMDVHELDGARIGVYYR
jgi:ABC-type enterochelin transport system ATPase subunit